MKKGLLIVLGLIVLTTMLSAIQRDKVLVEIGTGAWCTYCPGAAMGADDLVLNGHQVAIIENHNGDPFATTDSNGRNSYYAITGYPTAWFDGLNPSVGGSHTVSMYSNYLPKVNARLAVPSHFTIAATGTDSNYDYTLNVVLDKVEPDTNTNLRLHAVVTESHIQYSWQGQTHLEFVARHYVDGLAGTTINFGTGTQVTVPLAFTMNPAWLPGNCEMVIFLQNHSTKEVLQAVKYSFPELYGAYAPSLTSIDFPDTYITGEAVQPLTIHNYWNITATGTITSDNPAVVIEPAARLNFSIPPHSSASYNVKFLPTATGDITANITITSNMPENENLTIPVTGYGFLDTAPVVTEVIVSGVPVVTMLQTATYTYTDADNDVEGASSYQWYRTTPPSTTPVAIDGANTVTYRLTQADIGSYITFEVLPRDSHTMPGTAVSSTPTSLIEVLPAPQNLTAQVIENHDVQLTWQAPNHFTRDFLGYRVFRGGLAISVINNPSTTTFTDTWLNPGEYQYWVTSVFTNPVSQSDPSNVVTVNITSNEDDVTPILESVQVYPNPFSVNATVFVNSKANTPVEVDVFNIKGQLLHKMAATTNQNGSASLALERSDTLVPGLYFLKVNTASGSHTRKVLLLNR